jgi:hypothetical protein
MDSPDVLAVTTMTKSLQFWSLWYPQAAATGLLIARGLVEPAEVMLAHAVPDCLTVEVADRDGRRLAYGQDLPRTLESPMCRLTRRGDRIEREDLWPSEADLGALVILPGGEVGALKQWWHADDRKEWRWQVEFYNALR